MKALTDMTFDELQDERVKVFQQRLKAIHDGDKDRWCELVDYSEIIAIEIDSRLAKQSKISADKVLNSIEKKLGEHYGRFN